jgi:hypothetical protein
VSIALLLRKATIGRPGSEEKTGYDVMMCNTAHKIRWQLSCTSEPSAKCKDRYFPQITQTHKYIYFFDKLAYLLGEFPQCAITAARFVTCCHKKRATSEEQTPL